MEKLRASHRRLWDATEYFRRKLAERFPPDTGGESLVRFFVESVARRLHFTEIVVEDELNAYLVFETLNARSLRLTSTDLLKNYLLSLFRAGPVDLSQARAQWNRVTTIVELDELPTFLRYFLASRRELVRAERLFKAVKQEVRTREAAFELLDQLERAAHWYRALSDPQDESWNSGYASCREHIRALRLFGVVQFKPLALAVAAQQWPADEFARVLRACVVLSFRFNVIGKRNPNQMEAVYNEAAIAVTSGKARRAQEVVAMLRKLYVEDPDFREDFARLEAPTIGRRAKLAKYILFALERQLGGASLDFETAEETIEHILPERADKHWEASFSDEDHQRFVHRLGNLTILKRDPNNELGNADYATKRAVFARSEDKLTSRITAADWTPEAVRQRQAELAKIAQTVWRIDFPPRRDGP